MRRWLRWTAGVAGLIIVAAALSALAWTRLGPQPSDRARRVAGEAAASDDGWLAYGPAGAQVGVVLYPGARIGAAAYAPIARDLARASGARVVVADPPLRVALLDIDAADAVRTAHPDIERWIVAGHSLGGVAAARYATDPPPDVCGLLLWAGYPAAGDEPRDTLQATSISGSRDGVIDRTAYDEARPRLPPDTEFIELAGVTHAQFGDYGTQRGDGTAAVSDEQARSDIVEASSALVARVATRACSAVDEVSARPAPARPTTGAARTLVMWVT